MTSARLSPAANLLRNSKLFAIPPVVPLPTPQASSEPVPRPDTATTIYPVRAAIETPFNSLSQGEWGLKRSLPLKSTTRTKNPTIRYRNGIDTKEHIIDFESASDHVLTLKKWQELNTHIRLPSVFANPTFDAKSLSIFAPNNDNTTLAPSEITKQVSSRSWPAVDESTASANLPDHLKASLEEYHKAREASGEDQAVPPAHRSKQKPVERKRWRFAGPWLAGLTDMEFDAYLKKITRDQQTAFTTRVKQHMKLKMEEKRRFEAQEKGTAVDFSTQPIEISDEAVTDYMRRLRKNPREFGPLIAEFFDLPEGPKASTMSAAEPWEYGRDTTAAEPYRETGPPRSHPSAGLSYMQSAKFSQNDPVHGPQLENKPAPARILKVKPFPGRSPLVSLGVAGFVATPPTASGVKDNRFDTFSPVKGGRKVVARPRSASIRTDGSLELGVHLQNEYHLDEEMPVRNEDRRENALQLPAIDGYDGGRMPELGRRYSQQAKSGQQARLSQQAPSSSSSSDDMSELFSMLSGSRPRST